MQKVHDIPVLHDIALALGAQLASLACLGLAAQRDIIGKSDGFGADEALLEIAVDLARRLGRGRALVEGPQGRDRARRSEEHTSELQSLMRISYAVFCLKKKHHTKHDTRHINTDCAQSRSNTQQT